VSVSLFVIGQTLAGTTPLSDGVDYLRVVLSLLLCLALGVGMAFLAQRMQKARIRGANANLVALESLRLDAKTSVHAVRYGTHHALVATHAGGVAITLVDAPVDETVATEDAA
jgi:flagellar protein FliO/FliZ